MAKKVVHVHIHTVDKAVTRDSAMPTPPSLSGPSAQKAIQDMIAMAKKHDWKSLEAYQLPWMVHPQVRAYKEELLTWVKYYDKNGKPVYR